MSKKLVGATTAVFTVMLSVAVDEIVDVNWTTRDGSAKAGVDYEASSGTVEFLPGETVKQIDVLVYGQDDVKAPDKNFFIALSPPSNAVLGMSLLECVIVTDSEDGVAVLSIVMPQGKRGLKGDPGLSAYEQAVLMGYQGALEDWMAEIADASQSADRAENAAMIATLAGKIYATPADGVNPATGGVPVGSYFNVRSPSGNSMIDEYRNVNGVAVPTGKSYPSVGAVNQAIGQTQVLKDQAADQADQAEIFAERAEAAATGAAISGNIYQTPAEGVVPVTGVPVGDYYNVRSPSDDSFLDEYQNVGGVATPTGKSYPSAAPIKDISASLQSQGVNILSVYGGIDDFGVAVELAYAKAKSLNLSTIFIPPRNYTAKTTANIALDRPFELKFGSNVVVYTVNEIDVFDIDMSHHFLSINAEEAVFIPSWGETTKNSALFRLNSRTMAKSTLIRGVSCIERDGLRFHNAINAQGLNYSLIRDCLFQAFDPIVNASSPEKNGHSMGSIVKDCFLHAHDEDGTPVTLINNGELACEGWSFEGGEYFGTTGIEVVNNLTGAGYYSPLLRVSNVHMNCKQFAKLDGVARVQFVGCDLQSRVMLDNPHSGLFELTGVQSFVLGAGTTITQAPTTGVAPQDSISVLSFKNAANGMVSAFASIEGASLWLYQNAPLVKFESDECYIGKVVIGAFNTDAFTAKFSEPEFNSKISLIESTRISDANVSTGVGVSDDVSFDSATGVLTLNKSPSIGNVYQVYSSVVPNNSVIKKIKSSVTIGKSFKVVIEASNVSIEHSATLYTPAQSVNKILYGATLDCFSYNSDICRVNQVTANTTILPVSTPPAATATSGVHGQKIFSAGFVYEYIVGTGWVRYAASTF